MPMSKGRLQNALAAACVAVSGAIAWAQGGTPVRLPLDNLGV